MHIKAWGGVILFQLFSKWTNDDYEIYIQGK